MLILFLCAAFAAGCAVPVQTACNTVLRGRLNSPFLAALVNSSIGTLVLTAALLLLPFKVVFSADDLLAQPWWIWGGGPAGAFLVWCAILLMQHLGALGTALSMLAGSVSFGMLLDETGLMGAPQLPFTAVKGAGLMLSLIGIALVLQLPKKLGAHQQAFSAAQVPFVVLGFLNGCVQVAQSACNSELAAHLGTSLAASWVTMAVTIVIMLTISTLRRESPLKIFTLHERKRPWIFCGGLCGAFFLIVCTFLLKVIGAGALVILTIAGQLAAALAIDHFALFGAARKKVSLSQLIGLGVIFCGVALIKSAAL